MPSMALKILKSHGGHFFNFCNYFYASADVFFAPYAAMQQLWLQYIENTSEILNFKKTDVFQNIED